MSKFRNGWVSNSSSSSFIIGIGVIKDEAKIRKSLKNCDEYDYKIEKVSELPTKIGWDNYGYNPETGIVRNVACVNSEPDITLKIEDPESLVLIVNVGNNEGDSDFVDEDYWCNYDKVDYDWFSSDQQKLMDILGDEDLISKTSGYYLGADRNG